MADKDKLREYLHWINALLQSMEFALHEADPSSLWRYAGYREFARKYNQIVAEIYKNISLPPVLDMINLDAVPSYGSSYPFQRQEMFEIVHANASILKSFLENEIGVVEDEIVALRNFFQARLRSAVLSTPKRELDIQNAVEGLLIGRGLQKGEDYDREVGRVKISAKEAVPDFILMRLNLALELKFVNRSARVREVVDEINADIAAYAKRYRTLLFIVYDLGHIRDELEFRTDLERSGNVSVIVVKH